MSESVDTAGDGSGSSAAVVEEDRYDLTGYMWRLIQPAPHRLRLLIYCVPGRALELAKRLRNRGFKARKKSSGTVIVDRPPDVVLLAKALGVSAGIAAALDSYAAEWSSKKKGVKVQPGDRDRQREAARHVMELSPSVWE